MLSGNELIAFVKENADMEQTELARAAGFVSVTATGKERVMAKQFCEALLQAKGVSIKSAKKPGKSAQYTTTVHKTGVILVGKTYVEKFGVEVGDELDIVIERDCIQLRPKADTLLSVLRG